MARTSPPGPPPTKSTQRRRRNKPASYGEAELVEPVAPASPPPPDLGFDAHVLVVALFDALVDGPEAPFYSAADWARVKLELWYANKLVSGQHVTDSGEVIIKTPGAQAWATFQAGLADLLVSPAEKRRVGIELKKATGADPDDAAADAAVAAVVTLHSVQTG